MQKFYKKKSSLRSELNIPENSFVVGHVSNFAKIKQVYHFSELAKFLKESNTLNDVYFVMCGDGKDRLALEEKTRMAEVSNHFRFLGKLEQDDLIEVYNSMDVLMLPSKHEGNPLSLLEAMACEKVIIGTDVGGIRETIDEDTGFLFKQNDINSLSKIVLKLKHDRELCVAMGKNGIERINNNYSVKRVMAQYYDVYDNIVKGARNKK